MLIRIGYELIYECPQPTPMMFALHVHPSRRADLVIPDDIATDPAVPRTAYRDGFDNICTRIIAPPGRLTVATDFVIADPGTPDIVAPDAEQVPVQDLPDDVRGRVFGVLGMLVSVASFLPIIIVGPISDLVGTTAVIFVMAIMVTVFMLAARRVPALTENPWLWGLIYGLITYVVMNLIVVPMRFGAPLPPSTRAIITQLFAHIVLVGWPTAFIARRFLRA